MRERKLQAVQAATAEERPVENRWAFLVGINDYSDSDHFPHLNFCRNDVIALRDLLQQVGYTVTCLQDGLSHGDRLFPSRRNIRTRLETLCEDVGPHDLLWVYFACHGTRQGDKKPRLVAADTYSGDLNSFISVAEVEELMRASGSKRLVLMLDACHIGVGTDTRSAVLADPEFIRNVYDLATGFALIAASTDQQSAFEQDGHGVFSSHVLSGLREAKLSAIDPNQNFVTIGSLQRYVLHRLKEWRNKHGYQQKPQGRADGDLGEIILVDYRKYSEPEPSESQQQLSAFGSSSIAGGGRAPQINSANQDLIESLQKQRQGIKCQLDAVTDELLAASGAGRVRLEADRDNLANQLRKIDSQLHDLEQSIQAEKDTLQKLNGLLSEFSMDARSFMAAYQRALLGRTIAPNLGNVESLIRHLVSDLDEPSPNRTLYRFVLYLFHLSDQLQLPVSLLNDLKQWVRDSISDQEEIAAIKAEIEREQAEHAKQKNCLLIKVYSSSLDEYHVKAWNIPDRMAYRQNWPEGAKPVQLPRSEMDATKLSPTEGSKPDLKQENLGEQPSYAAVEIKAVIQSIHEQCCRDYAPPELVEIFLPKQLMNSDVDGWRLREDKLRPLFGTRYPVLLRSSDRLTKRYLCKRVQEKKWESVERLLETSALPAFCEGNPTDIDGLYCQGETFSIPDKQETKDVVGLKLTQPASIAEDELEDLFETVLMDSALPIMIWARHLEVGLECPASIDQILGCTLRQLPDDLKTQRLEAFRRRQKSEGCHIGNHLSLLWDDPQLVPPDSE